jgi:hypothetical protein
LRRSSNAAQYQRHPVPFESDAMSDAPQPAVDPNLVARVKGVLLQPKTEWPVIEDEFATVESLIRGYAVPLAAIGPVAGLLGGVAFGDDTPILGLLLGAGLGYGLALLIVFALGLIIDALASSFGGVSNRVQAMKTAVYASTAGWVGGIGGLIPGVGGLISFLASCYGVYLLYLGLRQVMKSPDDKAVLYTVLVIVALVVASAIAAVIIAALVAGVVGGAVGLAAINLL